MCLFDKFRDLNQWQLANGSYNTSPMRKLETVEELTDAICKSNFHLEIEGALLSLHKKNKNYAKDTNIQKHVNANILSQLHNPRIRCRCKNGKILKLFFEFKLAPTPRAP